MRRHSVEPTSGAHRSNESDGPDRRTFLRATAGMATATIGVAVASPTAADSHYDVVLDVVEDLGADDTGGEPINDALAEAVEHDSVKVEFPDGEYVIDEGAGGDGFARWDFGDGEEESRVGDLALVGTGDATLRPPDGGRHNILTLWGRDITVENFTIDQGAPDTSTGITTVAEKNLLLRDITFVGEITGDYEEVSGPNHDEEIPEDPKCLIPALLDEDGEGLIENVRCPDGGPSLSRKGGVWVNFVHAGDLLFRRCEFSNFADNAIYASPPGGGNGEGGSVRVENCYFKNNNVTAIRLGTPGSYAKDCTVVTEAGEVPATPWGAITSRAGWVWYEFDGSYENVDVFHDHPSGQGIFDHTDNTQDVALEVRDSRITLNNDGGTAIRFSDPGVERLTVENVSVTGEATNDEALHLGNCEIDVDNLCIHQTGENRDGIVLDSVTGSISDSAIDVTGEQFVVSGDTDVEVTNLHDEGDCPLADSTHDYDADETGPTPTRPDDSGRDDHLTSEADEDDGEGEDVDYDFRISDADLVEDVVYGDDMHVGSVTVTNHGDETETVDVGVWNDFLEAFLAGTAEEVTLEPDESTTVEFSLSQDISSPGSTYDLAISTGSDRVDFTISILEADDDEDEGDEGDEDEGENEGDENEDNENEDQDDEGDEGDDETDENESDEGDENDDDEGDDEDSEDGSDGQPGFTGLVTLGALATSGGAILRRLRSADREE